MVLCYGDPSKLIRPCCISGKTKDQRDYTKLVDVLAVLARENWELSPGVSGSRHVPPSPEVSGLLQLLLTFETTAGIQIFAHCSVILYFPLPHHIFFTGKILDRNSINRGLELGA